MAGQAGGAPPVSFDFNNDGSSDYPVSIIGYDIGSPASGAVRIWSGASKAIIHTVLPATANTLFGWSVGSAGDLNADGFDDLVVGEPLWGPNGTLEGRVHVYSGANASELLTIPGFYPETALGRFVTGIGDWDGDGVPDIAASGWDIADTNSDGVGDDPLGIVFIFSGADGSELASIIEPTATQAFGLGLFGLGDVTGDGKADLAIVDRAMEGNAGASGRVFVFAGRAAPALLSGADAHRVLVNADIALRHFAAQVDVMHPDLWLAEPVLQVVSLTAGDTGGVNEGETRIDLIELDGTPAGSKGYRPTLVLAGDVNLDSRVDALDLQVSISQLGTDPQAIGVMPIADQNADGIVDMLDIQLVLNGYGEQTDIYTGLWDGSRLLAVVGGASGFGLTPASGTWGQAPGITPIGNCPPLALQLPPDLPPAPGQGASLVPSLLRGDARANCATCPECDEPDPGECYECDKAGEIVGGDITATVQDPNHGQAPGQPLPGQTVCFTWAAFQVDDRWEKCKDDCGGDGTQKCPIEMTLGDSWVIEKKDPATGEWDEEHPVKSSGDPGNPEPCITGAVCEEYRFKLTSASVPEQDRCEALAAVTKIKEVQFAEFTLDWECVATTPSNRQRSTIGLGEAVKIWVADPEAGSAIWEVTPNLDIGVFTGGRYIRAIAPGHAEVTATINGCRRKIPFEIILPSRVNYTKCPQVVWHHQEALDLRYGMWLDLDPDNVSFYGLEFREAPGPASNITGDYLSVPESQIYHNPGGAQYTAYDNVVRNGGIDVAGAGPLPSGWQGGFEWVIPIEVRLRASSNAWILLEDFTVLQAISVNDPCITVIKQNNTGTACRVDPTVEPDLSNIEHLNCPPGQ